VPLTETESQAETATSAAEMTTDLPPILVGRKPAAYLTYNTLTLSETPALAPDVVASPTHPDHLQSECDPRAVLRA
jgi:hypothetical protein